MAGLGQRKHGSSGGRPARDAGSPGREIDALQATCDGLRKRLDDAERSNTELLSTISHDLRNPLSVVLVSVKMLARALGPDHASRRHVDAIGRAAEEINQLLQDVSDASSIERGGLVVTRDPQPLARIVEEALAATQQAARSKSLTVEDRIQDNLPEVPGEHDRLLRALVQLILNAIRFTPKGGRVSICVDASGDEVIFSVSDTGAGIADEQRAHLFARSIAGRKPMAQGTGLGIFVAKGIVDAHGGRVWVESLAPSGSRFCCALPTGVPAGELDAAG